LFRAASFADKLEESDIAPLRELAAAIGPLLKSGPEGLMACFLRGTPEDYLIAKLAGMGVLSALVAGQLQKSELSPQRMALVGWMFYLGASQVERLDLRHDEFSDAERDVFLASVRSGTLRLLGAAPEGEFLGQGWEAKLSGSENDEPPFFCRVLKAVEFYEALTHSRPYRGRFLGYKAIKEVVDGDGGDPVVLRSLLRSVSIYPPGSFVELSDKTIARVVGIHPAMPTRPIVQPLFDGEGRALPGALELDLGRTPLSRIANPVDETRLELDDPAELLQLRASLWWRPPSYKGQ